MNKPFTFNDNTKEKVRELNDKGVEAWSSPKASLIKTQLRNYYSVKQKGQCCYCHNKIIGISDTHLDHILPKKKYPEYVFTPDNLALSCPRCNKKKSEIVPLYNEDVEVYPKYSKDYTFIHPNYDNYAQHMSIKQIQNFPKLHIPLDRKGQETFKICGLVRFSEEYAGWDYLHAIIETIKDEGHQFPKGISKLFKEIGIIK